jgi:two-component system response regulator MprA
MPWMREKPWVAFRSAQRLRRPANDAREASPFLRRTPIGGRHGACRCIPSLGGAVMLEQANMDAQLQQQPLVLVVDDDARSASLLARLLRADGYDADVTTDGAAALARLTRDPVPHAVVTAFHLPHADGLAIARYARSRRAGMAIVMVTGYPAALASAVSALDQPVHVLTKPLDYAVLLRRLAGALAKA